MCFSLIKLTRERNYFRSGLAGNHNKRKIKNIQGVDPLLLKYIQQNV